MKNIDQDTIVAPVTSLINQTIGKIRISGDKCYEIVNLFLNKKINIKKNINIRKIINGNKILDQVVLLLFHAPNSFTGEDVIEIDCHGNKILVMEIVDILINNGCRLALPGEFSKRAYYNNKIDLIQAESINNLIGAKNKFSVYTNSQIINGSNSNRINKIKEDIIDIISKIQTSIDYPDYDDVEGSDSNSIKMQLESISNLLDSIIFNNNKVLKLTNNLKIVLTGETNVGKSSILNSIARDDVAIVSDVQGTTRDLIKLDIEYKGLSYEIWDTAGIRETSDKIEEIGILKAKEKIKSADLVVHVFDNIEKIKKFKCEENEIIILNKVDLINENNILEISSVKNLFLYSIFDESYKRFLDYLDNKFSAKGIFENNNIILLSNYDDLSKIKIINKIIKNIISELKNGQFLDIILNGVYECLSIVNNILGINNDNEVIDNIFNKYCLGK